MVDSICDQLGDKIEEVLSHKYGNYLFQRLVTVATDEQKFRIVEKRAEIERRSPRHIECSSPQR